MKNAGRILSVIAFAALGSVVATGCSSSSNRGLGGGGGGGDDSGGPSCYYGSGCSSGDADGGFTLYGDGGTTGPAPLTRSTCSNGGSTTITGRVYDPGLKNPLPNVTVYIPQSGVNAIPTDIQCGCSSLYPVVLASAVTDAGGNFKLSNATDGAAVPLVVQVGKWRMQYKINVKACVDNVLPDHTLHMPKNHVEGDMPQFAISTGGADSLECLPLRMGIDASEYVAGPGTKGGGHLHIYTAPGGAAVQGGTAYASGSTLWDSDTDLGQYDVVFFSCEGMPTAGMSPQAQQIILNYANNGGRIFASHYHYALFNAGPFASLTPPMATWDIAALNQDNDPLYGKIITTLPNGKTFPEGQILSQWLQNVGALTNGELPIHYARDNAEIGSANTGSQQWIVGDRSAMSPGKYTQYFSFDTSGMGTDGRSNCGRIVYSDLHVSGGPNNPSDVNTDYPGFSPGIVPDQCNSHDLTPQEKALEFMMFDLSSCLIPIGMPPGMPMPPM